MADKIYVLFSCDEWKSTDSMSMVCATCDASRMAEVIASEIAQGNMTFFWGNSEEEESLSAFKEFCAQQPDLEYVNSPLEYGHLEIVEDGKVL